MARALKVVLDESNPNKVAAGFQLAKAGTVLEKNAPQTVSGAVVSDVLVLPEGAKAAQIISAFGTVGTVTGYFTPVDQESTPATTQVAVNATGDILFLTADAVTAAEVTYIPIEGSVVEDIVNVAASAAVLLASRSGRILLEAEVLTGATPGVKTINARDATPGGGTANLNLLGTGVDFNAADVVAGTARIKYIALPGVGSGADDSLLNRLAADSNL